MERAKHLFQTVSIKYNTGTSSSQSLPTNTYKSYKMTLIGNDILDIGTRKWESVQKQQSNFLMGRGLDGDLISLPGTSPQPQTFDLPPVPNVSSLIKLLL